MTEGMLRTPYCCAMRQFLLPAQYVADRRTPPGTARAEGSQACTVTRMLEPLRCDPVHWVQHTWGEVQDLAPSSPAKGEYRRVYVLKCCQTACFPQRRSPALFPGRFQNISPANSGSPAAPVEKNSLNRPVSSVRAGLVRENQCVLLPRR